MKMKEIKVTIMYADGTTMSGEEFKKNGRVILPENNVEVNREARRMFYPEAIEEERRRHRRLLSAQRRDDLLAELAAMQTGTGS